MNATQQGVIALLKSAITGEKTALPEQFDMAQAAPVLRKHSIMAMGYAGALNCGIEKQQPVMQKLRMDYAASLMKSQGQLRDINRVCRAFEENGIDYMPLKGCNLKPIYPSHELRSMGDADILIRQEQYDRIRPIMQQLGFKETMENDHELVWQTDALYLELHKKLVPSSSDDYFAYYGEGWQFAKLQSGSRYAMPLEDEFVFLLTHFAKHYRDSGIGCRHVVDLWIYLKKHPDMDMGYIHQELKKLKLLVFYENLYRTILAWFEGGDMDSTTELITQVIFVNGNWGNSKNHMLYEVVQSRKKNGSAAKGKLKWFAQQVFLSYKIMRYRYPVLQRCPVLLPAYWVVRWCDILLHKRENITKKYGYFAEVTEDDVASHEKALAFVGLTFDE